MTEANSKNYRGIFEVHTSGYKNIFMIILRKLLVSTIEYMQVPNRAEQGVQRSERPLLAWHTCRNCFHYSIKDRFMYYGHDLSWRLIEGELSLYCIQGKSPPPPVFFSPFSPALWPEGEFKTGQIELYIKDYMRKLEHGRIKDWVNQSQISKGRKWDWANSKLYTVCGQTRECHLILLRDEQNIS